MRAARLRWVVPLGVVSALLAVAAVAFGPAVRARVRAEAERRDLEVTVGGVRPGWFAVRLLGVTARRRAGAPARAAVDEVVVSLGALLRPVAVELRGGSVVLGGRREEPGQGPDSTAGGLALRGRDLNVSWRSESESWGAELEHVSFARDAGGTRVRSGTTTVRRGALGIALDDLAVDLAPDGRVLRAHAQAGEVTWRGARPAQDPAGAPSAEGTISGAALGTRSLRDRLGAVSHTLLGRLAPGATTVVDALTWTLAPDEGTPLTVGPGPLTLTTTATQAEVRFSGDTRPDSPSLTFRAVLPATSGEVSLLVEGGPLSLSQLGLRDGAAGLTDVERTTLGGRVQARLAEDGSALTFDADVAVRGASISQPRLASEVVRGIDAAIRARGALDEAGRLRVDDLSATLGLIHVEGSGSFEAAPDHLEAEVDLQLPATACQALLESVPTALLPDMQGARWSGAFGANGHLAFDTRHLDDLDLRYDIQDQCRVAEVPPALARERFKRPFVQRVYLPDGSTTDRETGPGTATWTPLDAISPFMPVAVMTTEDGGFERHHGFYGGAIRASLIANLKAGRFVRGASTITMQLAKNLFLSRTKTLSRKLEEVVLTDYLEQVFSKDEIMELYLNVVELGPSVYGVTDASEYYFGRTPAELDLAECLVLASFLPSPLRYGAMREGAQVPEGWMRGIRSLMRAERKRNLITDAELAEGLGETVTFWHGGPRPAPRLPAVRHAVPDATDGEEPPANAPFDAP